MKLAGLRQFSVHGELGYRLVFSSAEEGLSTSADDRQCFLAQSHASLLMPTQMSETALIRREDTSWNRDTSRSSALTLLCSSATLKGQV